MRRGGRRPFFKKVRATSLKESVLTGRVALPGRVAKVVKVVKVVKVW